jgi:release factor glutamine methyltransferase
LTVTVDGALREAAARIAAAHGFDFDTAFREARALLAHAVGRSPAQLTASGADPLDAAAQTSLAALAARRAEGEPVAYLTGQREFFGLEVRVSPATLIPRPETELLVEAVLERVAGPAAACVVDAGTGSGAVALAVARARPRSFVAGIDASAAALAVARANAARLAVPNVGWVRGDWLAALAPGSVDVVASNPPYVAAGDPHLSQGDLRFEPPQALVGGADGLDAIRSLVSAARNVLAPGGWLVFEHGHDQAPACRCLLEAAGFEGIFTQRDLAGHARVTGGRRASS